MGIPNVLFFSFIIALVSDQPTLWPTVIISRGVVTMYNLIV